MLLFIIILLILITLVIYNKKGVPIFLYHEVGNNSNVSTELFEEHLKIIQSLNMTTLTMSEYYEKKIKDNSILITFDDGYRGNYENVFPLLKKYNMKVTIFLNTLYIKNNRKNENIGREKKFLHKKMDEYLTWQEIKEMNDSGLVDFQAHSHKHMAIFADTNLQGLKTSKNFESEDYYLYKNFKLSVYPIFNRRGEYAKKGVIIKKSFFQVFQDFYDKQKLSENKNEKEVLKILQKFINDSKNYFYYETDEDYHNRIKKDFLINKKKIEKHLSNKVIFFCWPWGHRSKNAIKILKKLGVKGFISTKKGNNSKYPNWSMIKRMELRNYSTKKFRLNIYILRNLILGKIYSWLS